MIDASALTAFILKEPGWQSLIGYFMNSVSVDHVIKEVMNVIWKVQIRGIITKEYSIKLRDILMSLISKNIIIEPEEKYVDKAFTIAMDNRITIYDALYVALAISRGLPLLTLDNKQGEVARRIGINVVMPFQ
ncbi:type II toxin-antitoxin system VapC family toxin [Vulcanisaeta sp. JCM 16159]|uniref:type II toxin-antitoxin system VapC family toxin n=1 Tax=Vulcanisaeta sp. JCM 16159 TaxID=1295371 RepID=UPI000A805CF7|nr:type II toxin-antitoxin system VapC family toxin [Vulcanisaeta sp. JCM 16159]